MKIKTLSRSEEKFTRECKGDVVKVFRNLEPALHPFDKAREYTRALTATKLDKMFAKPLVGTCCCDMGCWWWGVLCGREKGTCSRACMGRLAGRIAHAALATGPAIANDAPPYCCM